MKPKPTPKKAAATSGKASQPRREADNESILGFEEVPEGTPFVLVPGAKTLPEEQWTPVFFLPGYKVSNIGQVLNEKTNRLVNHKLGEDGYFEVTVKVPVHVLVANSFIPNPEHLEFIRHKDGSRTHNHFMNLEFTAENPDAT